MGKLIIFDIKSLVGIRGYIILCTLIFLTCSSNAFSQKLTFTFDASGNQTKRVWLCINCPTLNISAPENTVAVEEKEIAMEIGDGSRLLINKTERTIKIQSDCLSRAITPFISLVNFEDKRKVTINSFKKEDYVEFSTDKLMAGIYLLRISVNGEKWTEVIIEKVKEA
ncbi:hypothetical protein [Sphingobacterium puteale]|uniref:hypothetical protein n=1 Tax=Sphingobacterium puteale TaxID=2420510 RepID=UPI003D97FA99